VAVRHAEVAGASGAHSLLATGVRGAGSASSV